MRLPITKKKRQEKSQNDDSINMVSISKHVLLTLQQQNNFLINEKSKDNSLSPSKCCYSLDDLENDNFNLLNIGHYMCRYQWQGNFSSPINENLINGIRVLDIGCGAGSWILDMAAQYPSSTFLGLDKLDLFPSSDKRFPNTGFIQANVLDGIPFPDNTFDFVCERFLAFTALTGWQFNYLLNEMIRVCKPDGWIEIMEYRGYENAGPIAQAGLNQIHRTEAANSENTVDLIPQMMKNHLSLADFKHFEKRGPIGAWGGQYGSLMLKNYKSIGKSIYLKLHDDDPDYDEFITSVEQEFDRYKTTIGNFRCFARKRTQ
ncbi:S-adenosyl-L-methionine-dependent methyltransferase [Gigaspora margarita]|uniref:S-adenosyl-L-methionine-dependent methyltransferase n=1 Tax=Gigaspora margarita TaxID=4874 RepID=A0A8H3X6Y3_GIGMA|nr:S-adenosyl-L-methionine-dependent methyltransferase [Gigaspora margarita]